jgi:sec-independent protein translocase protein TatB
VSDVGLGELLIIAVVGLLVFGPDRLPEMAKQAGRWVNDLRAMVAKARADVGDSLGVDPAALTDPKGALTRGLLGADAPADPRAAATTALGLDEVADTAASVRKDVTRPFDPDAT